MSKFKLSGSAQLQQRELDGWRGVANGKGRSTQNSLFISLLAGNSAAQSKFGMRDKYSDRL
jgi:hypothetical protein